jgi:hypothetical protein
VIFLSFSFYHLIQKSIFAHETGRNYGNGNSVVCNTNVGDTDKIITDYNSGVLVKEFNTASYAAAVERMQQPYSEQEIIHGANEYFSLANGIDRYAAVYLAVMS